MKKDTFDYLKEVDWRVARRFEPPGITGIRSMTLHVKEGVLGFGTKSGSMHEFRFGDTNKLVNGESPADVLEESYVTLLEPLHGKRPEANAFTNSPKADGGICIALHPSELTLVTADNSTVRFWDMEAREHIRSRQVMGGSSVVCLGFDPKGQQLAVGLANGMLMVYQLETWEPIHVLRDRTSRITVASFSPNGDLLASGSGEGIIDVYDVQHNLQRVNVCMPSKTQGAGRQSQGHGAPVAHIDWSADSGRLKSQCDSMELLFWEVGLFRGGAGQVGGRAARTHAPAPPHAVR
jgi:WD40 repeat protein